MYLLRALDRMHEASQPLVVKDMDPPNSVAGTKEDRLQFLKGLCQEPAYKAMVQWLDANLVQSSLTLLAIATAHVESRAQMSLWMICCHPDPSLCGLPGPVS